MKKLLATAAVLASLSVPALAKDVIMYRGGDNFTTYKTNIAKTGELACGVMTMGTSDQGHTMMFTFKTIKNHDGLLFLISKDSWQFGKTSKPVPFKVYFDDKRGDDWAVRGVGEGVNEGKLAELSLWAKGPKEPFLSDFAHADTMYIKFESGNESLWRITMNGSRDAVNAYRDCLGQIGESETQPFAETVPFNSTKSLDKEESF
jgi:opacity protein-like surface antigen